MVLNFHRNHEAYYGRGEEGVGVWRLGWGGGREIINLSLHCHYQNDFCVKAVSYTHLTLPTRR